MMDWSGQSGDSLLALTKKHNVRDGTALAVLPVRVAMETDPALSAAV